MLTERLQIQTIPAQIQVQPGKIDFFYAQLPVFQNARVSTRPHEYSFTHTEATKLSINMDAVREDIGYLNPRSMISRLKNKSLGKATEAIREEVADGLAVLDNPQKETAVRIKGSKGRYSISTDFRGKPSVPIEVSFSDPSRIQSQFNPAQIEVRIPDFLKTRANWEGPRIFLSQNPEVRISVVPIGRRINSLI